MNQPIVRVGIVVAQQIHFSFHGNYTVEHQPDVRLSQAVETVTATPVGFVWRGKTYRQLTFVPAEEEVCSFSLFDVTIGINFHWERKETQTFRGTLRFLPMDGKVCAVNLLPVEQYLASVACGDFRSQKKVRPNERTNFHASFRFLSGLQNHLLRAVIPSDFRQ